QQQLLQGDISKIIAAAAHGSNLCTAASSTTFSSQNKLAFCSSLDGSRGGDGGGSDEGGGGVYENGVVGQYASVSGNHIKLPDMQTLAHSLPKYPPPAATGNGGGSRKVNAPSSTSHASSGLSQ